MHIQTHTCCHAFVGGILDAVIVSWSKSLPEPGRYDLDFPSYCHPSSCLFNAKVLVKL